MNEFNKEQLAEVLAADRGPKKAKVVAESKTGGTVKHTNEATGKVAVEEVALDLLPAVGIGSSSVSQASVQLDMSRNINFNKVEITLWARTPCEVGAEAAEQGRLIEAMHGKALEYMNSEGLPLLRHWNKG